jgi:hypothetical protein
MALGERGTWPRSSVLKAPGFMPIYLPVSFLLLQCATLAFVPSIAGPVGYLAMVAAPLRKSVAGMGSWPGQ